MLPARRLLLYSLLIFVGVTAHLVASPTGVRGEEPISFSRQVKPILAKRCFACHGPDAQEAGLALDAFESATVELDSSLQAIVPHKASSSELIRRITSGDESERMPPDGEALSPEEILVLHRWIEQGAEYEKHWSFQPVQKTDPPAVEQTAWTRNDIDRFILSRIESRGLTPNPLASKAVLARRLYYDLIGLPPTPSELDDFLADDRADAYERLVEQLLASPHYGEQWARHWLDVVRYAETNSYERDAPKPHVWKYRDYVIRSLNDDKPFDTFVREQLAGDELDEVNAETMIATGYYRLGIYQDEPDDVLQVKADEMDDIVSTTGQAFLGLTVGCARCHDHKIDPFPQRDYFGLVAFMADITPFGQRDDFSNSLWYTGPPENKQQRKSLEAELGELHKQRRELEQAGIQRMEGRLQRLTETDERAKTLEEHLSKHLTEAERQQYSDLNNRVSDVDTKLKKLPRYEHVLALASTIAEPPVTQVHQRGNPHVLGDEVEPHFPQVLGGEIPAINRTREGQESSGRRHVLAEWIASDENPLTSRVIANRVWQHHFGRGVVRTPNNFGQLGIPPTHPELLDFLATYLIEHNWRLKSLHRLIVTSNTYRMSSVANSESLAADPNNDLFWRYDMRRLTAEQVRDSVLLVSGQLNRESYGPSFYPKLSREVLATQSRPGQNWGKSNQAQRSRRSIYIHAKRSLQVPLLTAFDLPDPDSSCEARFNTTQPAQALTLLHSKFLHDQAIKLAKRVASSVGTQDEAAQVVQTIRYVLGRKATEAEVSEGLALLNRLRTDHEKTSEEALKYYCLTALNFSEFLYLD